MAVLDRDPACQRLIEPLLYFKGFHALQTYRLAHALLKSGRRDFALYLQSRASSVFDADINPAARIGKGIFLDHATGLVVGETTVIEDDVSILQGVTLGGTGKETGDRHPKIRHGVLIGAGAKILWEHRDRRLRTGRGWARSCSRPCRITRLLRASPLASWAKRDARNRRAT